MSDIGMDLYLAYEDGYKAGYAESELRHKCKPITNYDRIISKTPKELAEFIWGVETDGRAYGCRGKAAWLKWLQQEETDES